MNERALRPCTGANSVKFSSVLERDVDLQTDVVSAMGLIDARTKGYTTKPYPSYE